MNVINMPIDKIIPYEHNTKVHTKKQVDNVAKSIKRYGFTQPIVIDKDGIIVIGHCRTLAAKKLGLKEIPCVCVDDLTAEQVAELRIVDNKTNESKWDIKKLNIEMPKVELKGFDFKFMSEEQHQKNKDIALNTQKRMHILEFDEYRAGKEYEMPELEAVDIEPKRLIRFNQMKAQTDFDCGVHFYMYDYQFESFWSSPDKFMPLLAKFDCVLTPHYSVYSDMALPIKIYNTYRGKLLGQMMQDYGITVVPTVYWGDKSTYDYSFEGLPENGTLSIYTMGWQDPEFYEIKRNGLIELLKRKQPKRLLIYTNGYQIKDVDFGNCKVKYYKNDATEAFERARK